MDVLTHTAVAAAIGMAGYRRWGRRGTWWLAVAANLPEIERVIGLVSPAAFVKVAYGAGHSLLTAPVLGLLLAAPLARRRDGRFAALVVILGLGSHLALDLVSGPGVRLLWPLTAEFYGLRLLTRYDLLTLAVLAFTLIGPRLLNLVNRDIGAAPFSPQKPARAGLTAVAVLLALRSLILAGIEGRAAGGALAPSALHPLSWYVVSDAGNAYTVEEITPWSAGPTFRLRKEQPNRAFETAADTPLAQAFLRVAQFPQYSLERGSRGMLVRIRDLRFYTPLGQGKECSVEIEVTPQLEVVSQRARM